RTFAFDLKLSTNFEVSLDEKALLAEAVDNLIYKAGTDKDLTKVLVHYALLKADQDKSWDISRDLREIAELLSKDDHARNIKLLADQPLAFFSNLREILRKQIETHELQNSKSKRKLIAIFSSEEINASGFNRESVYNRVNKIAAHDFENAWNTAWFNTIDT